jgi:cold shock protein
VIWPFGGLAASGGAYFRTQLAGEPECRKNQKLTSAIKKITYTQSIFACLNFVYLRARRALGEPLPSNIETNGRLHSHGGKLIFLWKGFIMSTGTVKWFNATKGFGFIQPDDGGQDVFVHISAVERAGMRDIAEGQKLGYEMVRDAKSGKMSADQLTAA